MFYQQTTLNVNGRILDLMDPIVMGIINVTPDSFYKGSRMHSETAVLAEAEKMLTEGVAILDVGGMSTRPGAEIIEADEEMRRVLPVIKALAQRFPQAVISIDTLRADVARACIEAGAGIINDISAGTFDDRMFKTVAELKDVPYILMHKKGDTPATMQKAAVYDDIMVEILDFFIEKIGILRGMDVKDIIIDPGFGFGKTIDHNYILLNKIHVFKMLDVPILAGLSRKSLIWKTLDITPEEALNGTTVLNLIALQQGATILRVHDVKEAIQTIKLYKRLSAH